MSLIPPSTFVQNVRKKKNPPQATAYQKTYTEILLILSS